MPGTTVTVAKFGAKGDGQTNDTEAIRAAIEHCRNSGCGRLTFAPGRDYVIDEPLQIAFSDLEVDGIISRVIGTRGDGIDIDYYSPFDFQGVDFRQYFVSQIDMARNITVRNLVLRNTAPWRSEHPGGSAPYKDRSVSGIGVMYGADITVENIRATDTQYPVFMVWYGHTIQARHLHLDGGAEHFTGMDLRTVDQADGHGLISEQAVARIEQEHVEFLLRQEVQLRAH